MKIFFQLKAIQIDSQRFIIINNIDDFDRFVFILVELHNINYFTLQHVVNFDYRS